MAKGIAECDIQSFRRSPNTGAMFDPSAVFDMDRIAVGPDGTDAVDVTAPVSGDLRQKWPEQRRSTISDLTMFVARIVLATADSITPGSGRPVPGSG